MCLHSQGEAGRKWCVLVTCSSVNLLERDQFGDTEAAQ